MRGKKGVEAGCASMLGKGRVEGPGVIVGYMTFDFIHLTFLEGALRPARSQKGGEILVARKKKHRPEERC